MNADEIDVEIAINLLGDELSAQIEALDRMKMLLKTKRCMAEVRACLYQLDSVRYQSRLEALTRAMRRV